MANTNFDVFLCQASELASSLTVCLAWTQLNDPELS